MKVFVLVLIAATVIGGFAGGELTGQTFTIWGAALGGLGIFSVLMGLGAFFSHQENKKNKEAPLTPEMRAVFARMAERQTGKAPVKPKPSKVRPLIEEAVQGLIEQDMESFAAGKFPERRLIPHHAIKRDVIVEAFEVDFRKLSASMQNLNREHFESQLEEIRQLDHKELDEVLMTMKEQRTDLVELERQVRKNNAHYSIVDPLF